MIFRDDYENQEALDIVDECDRYPGDEGDEMNPGAGGGDEPEPAPEDE